MYVAFHFTGVTTLDELYELCRPMLPPIIDEVTFKRQYHIVLEGFNKIGGTKGLEKSMEISLYMHDIVTEHSSLDCKSTKNKCFGSHQKKLERNLRESDFFN